MTETSTMPTIARHGSHRLVAVDIDSYNVEIKNNEGLLATAPVKARFSKMIDRIRKSLRKGGDDPLGKEETSELSTSELDEFLLEGDPAPNIDAKHSIKSLEHPHRRKMDST